MVCIFINCGSSILVHYKCYNFAYFGMVIKMKQIIKHIPASDVTFWEASDGATFIDQKSCKSHEAFLEQREKKLAQELKFKTIKKARIIENEVFSIPFIDTFYFASSEEELEMIKVKGSFYDNYTDLDVYGELIPNEWITFYRENGGDYKDEVSFYTLSYIKEEMKNFLEKLEKIEREE